MRDRRPRQQGRRRAAPRARSSARAPPPRRRLPIVTKVNANVHALQRHARRRQPVGDRLSRSPTSAPTRSYQGPLQKSSGTPYGYVLDTKIPPIQTLPGAPDASVTSFDATVNPKPVKKGKKKIPYIKAPLLCNGTYFLIDGAFTLPERIDRHGLRALHDQRRAALPIDERRKRPPAGASPIMLRCESQWCPTSTPTCPRSRRCWRRSRRTASTSSGASATWSATAPTRTPARS